MEVTERRATTPLPAILYGAGLACLLVGQRVVPSIDLARWGLSLLGAAAIALSAALRLVRAAKADGERRAIERGLGLLGLVAVAAVLLLFATTDAGENALHLGKLAAEKKERFEALATVSWIVALLSASLPILFAELSLYPMRRAEQIEVRRVVAAGAAGLTLAFAASYGALVTYAAGELDVRADFSYFRTARPGDSTRKIVEQLDEPIRVVGFFPQLNEVGREVGGYLHDLARGAPKLSVELQDRLLVPGLAKENKVSQDGVVVIARGEVRETLFVGTDMNAARPKLKSLDGDFQKALLKALREQKIAYFTVGHGELNQSTSDPDGRVGNGLRKLLESQSYQVKDLGLAQGLGTDVPNDAGVVLVMGPSQAFLPAEVESLERYAKKGGHLLLALDPDAKVDLEPLAAIAGLTWKPVVLANDKVHLRRRFNESDRTILATFHYSSHASVTTLSRSGVRAPVILPGAAALEKRQGADSALKVDFAIRSLPDTFDDQNGNFTLDSPPEKRASWNLAAAVSKPIAAPADAPKGKAAPEERLFVVGDVDAFSDAALANEPNIVLFVDAVRWLGGEESFAGSVGNTEDVRIEHTKQKDLVWFYATIVGVPGLVLAAGLAFVRRSRRSPPKRQPPARRPEAPKDDEKRAA